MSDVIDKKIVINGCSKKEISAENKVKEDNKLDSGKEASLEDGYVQYWLSQSCEEI